MLPSSSSKKKIGLSSDLTATTMPWEGTGTALEQAPLTSATGIDPAFGQNAVTQIQDHNATNQAGYDVGVQGVPDTAEHLTENLTTFPATGAGAGAGGGAGDADVIGGLSQDFIEQQIRAALGDIDTSEQEALIRELMQGGLGHNILDARARMGAAGFGSSGALYGLEGDLQSKFGRESAQQIFDLRDREEEQARRAAEAALGLDIDLRDAATRDAWNQGVLEYLRSLQEGMPEPEQAAPAPSSPIAAVTDAARNPLEAAGATTVGTVDVPTDGEKADARTRPLSSRPPDSEQVGTDGGGTYYRTADGLVHYVRHGTVRSD